MSQDTEALPARDDREFPSDEELLEDAEWTRAWEWPQWLRTAGRELRGWRPDPRTLVVVLALVLAPAIVQIGELAGDFWRQLTTAPQVPPEAPATLASQYNWDRVLAGAELSALLAAAVIVAGAVAVVLVPRRLSAYVVVISGLIVWLATELAFTVAEFGLNRSWGVRAGYLVSVLFRVLLLALAVLTARSRPEPEPAPSD